LIYFFPDGSMSPIMDQDDRELLQARAAGMANGREASGDLGRR
jgi:hypothetical protein